MKTVLITGASTGIGKVSAEYFNSKGWQIIATARNTEALNDFKSKPQYIVLQLDVTEKISVENMVSKLEELQIVPDVVVNNAGYSVTGAFEDAGDEKAKRQFDVNVFGLMAVTKALLPMLRKKGKATIINIASVAGHAGMPVFSLYNASKFAVEGFSEALWFELRPFGIKVKIVEPGPIKTDFYGRSMDVVMPENSNYREFLKPVIDKLNKMGNKGLPPIRVAKTIYKAAVSNCFRLRYPVGSAFFIIFMRHAFPHAIYRFSMRKFFGMK